MATALTETLVLLRQYTIKLKKSGTRVPRIVLKEMGPSLDLTVRRHRAAPAELEKEACKQPKLGKKKVRVLKAEVCCVSDCRGLLKALCSKTDSVFSDYN
jgi:ribosome production factor 2